MTVYLYIIASALLHAVDRASIAPRYAAADSGEYLSCSDESGYDPLTYPVHVVISSMDFSVWV